MYLCARNGEISEESIRTATVVWIAVVGSESSCGRNRRSRDVFSMPRGVLVCPGEGCGAIVGSFSFSSFTYGMWEVSQIDVRVVVPLWQK